MDWSNFITGDGINITACIHHVPTGEHQPKELFFSIVLFLEQCAVLVDPFPRNDIRRLCEVL